MIGKNLSQIIKKKGLLYWSEVEAMLATEKFSEFWMDWYGKQKEKCFPKELIEKTLLESVLYTNKQIMHFENQDLLDFGGQTTLSGAVLYAEKKSKQMCVSTVGIGDSPIFKYKSKENKWETLFFDSGEMLPFVGLQAFNIQAPQTTLMNSGDLLLLSSDGIISSFERNPAIGNDLIKQKVLKLNVEPKMDACSMLKEILKHTNSNQIEYKGDPDDVAMILMQICEARKSSKSSNKVLNPSFPTEIDILDYTETLRQQMTPTLDVALPNSLGGTYRYPGEGKINISKRREKNQSKLKEEATK